MYKFLNVLTACYFFVSPAMGSQRQQQALSDAQIAQVILSMNDSELRCATQAKTISKNAEVLAFADRMVVAAQSLAIEASTLYTRIGITPVETEWSRSLVLNAKEKDGELARLTGADFDRAFLDAQIQAHEDCLKGVSRLEEAENVELQNFITSTVPTIQLHLDDAKAVRATLN